MIKSFRDDYTEYLKTAVKQFFIKINIESNIEP